MNKQFLTLGLAMVLVVIAGGLLIHSLSSRRSALTAQDLVAAPQRSPHPEPPAPLPEQAEQDPRLRPRQAQPDPLAQNLFPPELVMQFQSQIGLGDEQRQAIMAEMQQAQPKFQKLQQQLQEEVAALGQLLNKEHVELELVLAQTDKVQDLERQMKRTQLTLLISLKNRLTPEQQAKLQEFKKQQPFGSPAGANPPQAIQVKMQRLQAGIQQWQKEGRNPAPIVQTMQKFEPLMRAGQFKEADAALDDALKLLDEEKPR